MSSTSLPAAAGYEHLSPRYRGAEKSLWIEFVALANDNKALNLGQGFPDYPEAVPLHVRQTLAQAASSDQFGLNQYTRGFGLVRLVNALSALYSPLFGRTLNAMSEVSVFVGAYEALFCAINSLVHPGDEVIIIEPFFDCYEPMVKFAGGTPKFIPLRPKSSSSGGQTTTSADWCLDMAELRSLFSEKTRAIIINTPNNPLGKVFNRAELEEIGSLCQEFDSFVISDEVYEWLVYPGAEHVRIASLPGMWERTVTIGSAGKTFSATGWKLGWCFGPAKLVNCLRVVHQNCVYTCPTPIQEAVAAGLETELALFGTEKSYWKCLVDDLMKKRDRTVELLKSAGMTAVVPEGGYFMIADTSSVTKRLPESVKADDDSPKDFHFVRWLCKEKKLALIPPTAFYCSQHKPIAEDLVRFCFFKRDETLDRAAEILKKL